MAMFINRYPGYIEDLRNLISGLGQSADAMSFKEYMSNKAKDNSNPEKAQEAQAMAGLFGMLADISEKMTKDFLPMLSQLEDITKKEEDDISPDELAVLERAGNMEKSLLHTVERLGDLNKRMSGYNKADGYSELKSSEQLQAMFQMAESIDNLTLESSIIERKATQLGLRKRVAGYEKKSARLVQDIQDMVDNNIYLDPENIEYKCTVWKEKLEKKKRDVEDITSEKTREFYEKTYEQLDKEVTDLKEEEKKFREDMEANRNMIAQKEKALEELKESLETENKIMADYSDFENNVKALRAEYEQARKQREQAELEYSSIKESIDNLSGPQKAIQSYYDKRMNYEKWKKAYEGFSEFVDANKKDVVNKTQVILSLFDDKNKAYEAMFGKNEKIKQVILNAKVKVDEVKEWCPDKKIFTTTSKNHEKHVDEILIKLKSEMEKAEKEYQDDPSYNITQTIDALTQQKHALGMNQNELSEEQKLGYDVMEEQMEKLMTERNENYTDTKEVDAIINVRLNGRKLVADAKNAEALAKGRLDSNEKLMKSYEEDASKLRLQCFEKFNSGLKEVKEKAAMLSKEDYAKYLNEQNKNVSKTSISVLVDIYSKDLEQLRDYDENVYPDSIEKISSKLSEKKYERNKYSKNSLQKKIEEEQGKLQEANVEYEKTVKIREKMNKVYSDYRSINADQNNIYDQYAQAVKDDKFYESIQEKTKALLKGFDYAKKSADYKNSDEYNAIKTTLTELSKVNKDTPIEDINSLYANLGKAANDYLKAKDAQVRLFPSKQRIYRINYAKSIKEFCQKQQSLLKPESMDCGPHARKFMELTERQRENGKVPTMAKNEFFKEYRKNVLEKNKNEPGANNPQIDNKNLQNNKIQRHSHANVGKERKTMVLS